MYTKVYITRQHMATQISYVPAQYVIVVIRNYYDTPPVLIYYR
jgi:hypothetical protein